MTINRAGTALSMDYYWYKGQRFEVIAPKRGFIGRWTWIAYLETGKTLTGRTFRKTAAIKQAERAIKAGLNQ